MCATPVRSSRTAYDPFAWIYNCSMAEDFCRRAMPVIDRLLLSRLPAGSRMLDLCCGSGQMACAHAQRGYRVTGLDASEQMLTLAREKSRDLQLVLCDARHFQFPPVFDAAISTFNSLAHTTTTRDLQLVLQNARSALKPGGNFVFDLTMEEGYAAKWRGSFGEVHDGIAWTVRPTYDERTRVARNDVTVFRRQPDDLWQRSSFRIVQKCHSEREILHSLNNAGFRHIDSYEAERDLGMSGEFGRAFFVAA